MSGVGPRSANTARYVPSHPKGPTPLPRRAMSAPERESRGGGPLVLSKIRQGGRRSKYERGGAKVSQYG